MLSTTCCVCQDVRVDLLGTKDGCRVGRCLGCGLLRTLDRADDYLELYTEGNRYHGERTGQIPYRERVQHDYAVGVSRVTKLHTQQRVLDVGCANGGFLEAATHAGHQVEGLELNPQMAAETAQRLGVPIHTSWETITGRFDVITYHDVIEHVLSPVEELRKAGDYLQSGALLVLDTPDAAYAAFTQDPMASHHMKPREHLWFFTEPHLTSLLRRAGFGVVSVDHPIPGKLVIYARPWTRSAE